MAYLQYNTEGLRAHLRLPADCEITNLEVTATNKLNIYVAGPGVPIVDVRVHIFSNLETWFEVSK